MPNLIGEVWSAFDNRERAVLFWFSLFAAWAVSNQGVRTSVMSLTTTLLSKPILTVLLLAVSYAAAVIGAASYFGLWNLGFTKDTLIWGGGVAFVMIVNHDNASRDPDHFNKIVRDTLKASALIVFVTNLYVLPVAFELVLVPVVSLLAALAAFAELDEKSAVLKPYVRGLLGIFGIALLAYSMIRIVSDSQNAFTVENLSLLVLPVVLTLSFVPFVYALALYSGYENIFIRLPIWIKDGALRQYARRQIMWACLIDLGRVSRFRSDCIPRFGHARTRDDVTRVVAEFRSKKAGVGT